MIEIQGLDKTYSSKRAGIKAINGISFTCKPGRITGLLGPNGAGKTTTLRILATLIRPTTGSALVDGLDVTKQPHKVREKIGFLSGLTHLYGRHNAAELMHYFGTFYNIDKSVLDAQMEYLFDMLGINEYADRAIDKLSTGQRQRVNIARTLIHDPAVIIMDEPTLGLDLFVRKTVIDLMHLCKKRGKTVLFSSHDIFEIQELCDQVVILHQGRILFDGITRDVLEATGTQRLDDAFLRLITQGTG